MGDNLKMDYIPEKDILETIIEVRTRFEKENGRLLTVEEAVCLTEQIKKEIREKKESERCG